MHWRVAMHLLGRQIERDGKGINQLLAVGVAIFGRVVAQPHIVEAALMPITPIDNELVGLYLVVSNFYLVHFTPML